MKKRLLTFFVLSLAISSASARSSDNSETEFTEIEAPPEAWKNEECDMVLADGLCLYNGGQPILADAQPEGLIGFWSFDDSKGLDSSLNHLNVEGPILFGPGFGGYGASAVIGGANFLVIPPSPAFNVDSMTITFWLFLTQPKVVDSGLEWCPILYKGIENLETQQMARDPAIFFDRITNKVRIYFTTTANGTNTEGEYLTSTGTVNYQRWNHLAFVRQGKSIIFYLNGIMDAMIITEGTNVPNTSPLFVGNSPEYVQNCEVPGYIDDLRFYNINLEDYQIAAEAAPALGLVSPVSVLLGCQNCPAVEANLSCIIGYHLCTTIELHSAGYDVAMANGWIDWNSTLWTYNTIQKGGEGVATGICCVNQ